MCFEIILDLFTQLMTFQYFQLCLSYGMVLVPLPIFSTTRCSRQTSFLSWIRPPSPSTQSSTLRWYLCFVWSSIMKFLLPIICSISKTVITASAVTLAGLRMFATTRKQTNWSRSSLNPLFLWQAISYLEAIFGALDRFFFRLWHHQQQPLQTPTGRSH